MDEQEVRIEVGGATGVPQVQQVVIRNTGTRIRH